ncbi:MAG: glycogen-binding domain-containing protein [Kiritimatiellia bacterium]
MKIKSKVAAKTVTAKKPCTRKAATPKTGKPSEKNVVFTIRADIGKTVYLAGSFNQWSPTGKKMLDKKNDGVYTTSVKLAPGRYEYKFVIDGIWCADPENLDFVQNDHGTLNSVIVVA